MILSNEQLEAATQKALDAFWATIVAEFPEAKTGGLSPFTSCRLFQEAESAVNEWVWANCP